MNDSYVRTISAMGTTVTVQVVGHAANAIEREKRARSVARALEWFTNVTDQCSRFDPASELSRLTTQVGVAVPVSTLLFEAVRFAVAVAEDTNGAFDPTIGRRMEARGFDTDYRSGERTASLTDPDVRVSYRDVLMDADAQTITLGKPLILDLGAVAIDASVPRAGFVAQRSSSLETAFCPRRWRE